MRKKEILVLGAGGFIGSHLVKRLAAQGHIVFGADLKQPDFSDTAAHKFFLGDLRDYQFCHSIINRPFDEVYQLAADMGGAGYIFIGDNDFDVIHNSAQINLNIIKLCIANKCKKVFFSSSACIYPQHNQEDAKNPVCAENTAYPANPDSEYGWEKLFGERIYLTAKKNYNIETRIARFHNIYGPEGSYNNGKEKAPAAICRKVATAEAGGSIEIWGNGKQSRSFLFIDDCLDAVELLMNSDHDQPLNIGSEELITLNELAQMVFDIGGKALSIEHINGPIGVMGRKSDNNLIKEKLNWTPKISLRAGMEITYNWINQKVQAELLKNIV